jgi:uncharacterized protein YdhG (YjbR/CyaY superfamily)
MPKRLAPAGIDEYIAHCPRPVQMKLQQIRKAVHQAAPDASEKISYQMPCFYLHGNLVYFAAFAEHIGFYPGSSTIVFSAFREELSNYKTGKGSIRFPMGEPLPIPLIKRIVRHRANENRARAGKRS